MSAVSSLDHRAELWTRGGALVLLGLVLGIYWPAPSGEFVFEDRDLLESERLWEHTRFAKALPLAPQIDRELGWVALAPLGIDAWLTDRLVEPAVGGLPSPRVFRFHSLLLHAWNAILLALLVCRVVGRRPGWLPWLVAAGFAVHPVQTEAVVAISGRPDLLACTFSFIALLVHLRSRPSSWLGTGVVAGATLLAVLLRDSAAVLPAAILLLDRLRTGGNSPDGVSSISWRALLFPVLAVAAALLVGPGSGLDRPPASLSLADTWLTQARAQLHFVGLLAWPFGRLSNDYSFDVFPASDGPLAPLSGAVALGLFGLAVAGSIIAWRRGHRCVPAGVGLYLLACAAVVVTAGDSSPSERSLYVPVAAAVATVFGGAASLAARVPVAFGTIVLSTLLVGATVAHQRIDDWRTPYDLWKRTVRLYPRCARAQCELGAAAVRKQRISEAVEALGVGVALFATVERSPRQQGYYVRALRQRAELLLTSETPADHELAAEHYRALLREHDRGGLDAGDHAVILGGLLVALEKLGGGPTATAVAEQLSAQSANSPQKLEALLYLVREQRKRHLELVARTKGSDESRQSALVIDSQERVLAPLARAEQCAQTERQRGLVWFERGLMHQASEEWDRARDAFREASRCLRPEGRWTTAAYLAAECSMMAGNLVAAAEELRGLLAADPAHLAGWLSLGDLEQGLGNLEAAEEAYRRVLVSAPDNARALEGVKSARVRQALTSPRSASPSDANRASILLQLAERMLGERKYEKALEALKSADDNADGEAQRGLRAQIRLLAARVQAERRDWSAARAAYVAYFEVLPTASRDPSAVIEAAAVERQLGASQRGYEILEEHYTAGVRHRSLTKNLGALAVDLERADRALAWYRLALAEAVDPEDMQRLEAVIARLEERVLHERSEDAPRQQPEEHRP
ncbi:MAG: tetratricopeptide repeat protein [Planctomycetota bacterium]